MRALAASKWRSCQRQLPQTLLHEGIAFLLPVTVRSSETLVRTEITRRCESSKDGHGLNRNRIAKDILNGNSGLRALEE
jgi:hypothetical protein